MKIIFLTVMIVSSAWSASPPAPDADVWSLGKVHYIFKKNQNNVLVSENCLEKKDKCEGQKALLNKSKIVLSEADRTGGKNPGAVACKKIYKGEILILRDLQNNENAFCKFKDNTLVSASELY